MRLTRPSWSAYALIMGRCCTGYTAISGGMPGMTHSYQTQMGCLRLLRDTNPPLVMAASRLKCHQKKCAGFVVEGVRNVSSTMTRLAQGGDKTADHVAQEGSFRLVFRRGFHPDQTKGDRETLVVPRGDQQGKANPEKPRLMLAFPSLLGQRIFRPPL